MKQSIGIEFNVDLPLRDQDLLIELLNQQVRVRGIKEIERTKVVEGDKIVVDAWYES